MRIATRTTLLFGLALGLGPACSPGDGGPAETDTEASVSDASSGGEPGAAGHGRILVTVDDGTVHELVDVTSCETSVTKPSSYPLENGYGLTGRTADGAFRLSVGRAGLDEESPVFSGLFEGDFDEDGLNAKMLYAFDADTLTLMIDGADVAGMVGSRAIGPTRPYGDAPVFTIDARCE